MEVGDEGRRVLKSTTHCVTPLISMDRHEDKNVLLKLENTQPAGSYSVRGLGRLCKEAVRQGSCKVAGACDSSAGLALAYVAHELGLEAHLFMPASTDNIICDILRQMGAWVQASHNILKDAEEKATLISQKPGFFHIPQEHPLILEGISTLVPELKDQLKGKRPSALVCPGTITPLIQGLKIGLDTVGWSDVPLIAFGGPCEEDLPVGVIEIPVDEDDCVSACIQFANDHRMLVEPSCGAALAGIYNGSVFRLQHEGRLNPDGPIVVVVSGGVGAVAKTVHQ